MILMFEQGGELITEQIVESVRTSVCTIIVLTKVLINFTTVIITIIIIINIIRAPASVNLSARMNGPLTNGECLKLRAVCIEQI